MNKKRNWVVVLIVSAAAGFFALQNGMEPANDAPTATHTIFVTETATATPTPAYEGCSFMWAYHADPELTKKVDAAIRALNPSASANATFYGEDCVFADGHSTFSAMETDFQVHLPVEDLTNEEAFGNWMKLAMDVILQIPREELRASPGYVEFWFIKSETEKVIVRVLASQYQNEALEKSGAELFQFFYNNP
jgi:hypothetical protein